MVLESLDIHPYAGRRLKEHPGSSQSYDKIGGECFHDAEYTPSLLPDFRRPSDACLGRYNIRAGEESGGRLQESETPGGGASGRSPQAHDARGKARPASV